MTSISHAPPPQSVRREPPPFRGAILEADQPRTGSILQTDSQTKDRGGHSWAVTAA